MTTEEKWESVYRTKSVQEVSWYRPHLEASLLRIERTAADQESRIIDAGGGASTLVDDLLACGYRHVTVLDASRTALTISRHRLGREASQVIWIAADILAWSPAENVYDVWHDRAVFHFLTTSEMQKRYVELASSAVRPGGSIILGIFGPQGPAQCSGQDVARHDAPAIEALFAPAFCLEESGLEWHETPAGARQQFLYCTLRRMDP